MWPLEMSFSATGKVLSLRINHEKKGASFVCKGKIPPEKGLERLYKELAGADAIVIGAGAGLSASAGFVYNGARFHKHFPDFEARYGFSDMYSGGFYPYRTLEEHWAYWSRFIYINRYQDAPRPVYQELLELVHDKNYFVLTTNVDHCFQKAGFEKRRLFYTQGDYGLFQCSAPCCQKTYENEEAVRQMVARQKDMKIPSELVPRCPVCGKRMTMNLRSDGAFVEDEGWHTAAERYAEFLRKHQNQRVLFWDLGTGYNTPGIVKFPFWQMVYQWPNAVYACINLGQAEVPDGIQQRSVCISKDIGCVLEILLDKMRR